MSDYEAARHYVEELLRPQLRKGAVVLESLHEACVGIEESGILVYSYEKLMHIFTELMGMSWETAQDWMDTVIVPMRKEGSGYALVHYTGPGGS